MSYERELKVAIEAVNAVRDVILDIYNSPDLGVEIKEDNSPVTKADKAADEIIREILSKNFPYYSLLTEESFDDKKRLNNDYVWIVDPIDGTKDFVAHEDEFTVNIGLSYKHKPVLGVILIPVTGEIYYASKGNGAYSLKNGKVTKLHVNDKTSDLSCLISVFHAKPEELALIEKHSDRISSAKKVGSCLKACRIAEGKAELSYRLSDGTKEWDIAGSQILIEEAGGVFLEPDGTPIMYNRKDVYNRRGYIMANRKENFLL